MENNKQIIEDNTGSKNLENSDYSKNSSSDNVWMPLTCDWNKERLTQLKNLFPDLFTNEGKLNIDELKKVVDAAGFSETERYEFSWFGKSEAKRTAYSPANTTLIFDEERSVNPTKSENIIIEGENLETLKLLSTSYREQVKCIYIDPPYNTGKDFVYSDNYTEDKKAYWENNEITENGLKIDTNADSGGRYHSNWLNMMYSRLLIARQLLKEDGVIFISIDDNEVHHLRKLCDEVFGEENFAGEFAWRKKVGAGADSKLFFRQHEYILFYLKSKDSAEGLYQPLNEQQLKEYANPDDDLRGNWAPTDLSSPAHDNDPRRIYEVISPAGKTFKKCWAYTKENFNKLIEENLIWWGKENNAMPKRKRFLADKAGLTPRSWIDFVLTQDGKKDTEALKIENIFDYPKPVKLLQHFISIATKENDLILDFFGGSGTTGQAVMELNKKDGGNRKFILVQIPEATDENSEAFKAGYKKISDITIERNKRVIEKIKSEPELKELKNLFTGKNSGNSKNSINSGLGFKVFKLAKSNFPRVEWAPDADKTDDENIALLKKYIASKEAQLVTAFNRNDLLTEILLKNGFQLNYKIFKQELFNKNKILLATDGIKETLICLDATIDTDTVTHFKKHPDSYRNKKFICLERALDTTKKYNLKYYLGDLFYSF